MFLKASGSPWKFANNSNRTSPEFTTKSLVALRAWLNHFLSSYSIPFPYLDGKREQLSATLGSSLENGKTEYFLVQVQ